MDLFSYYPAAPGYKARDTARDAAEAMKPSKAFLQSLCLKALRDYGPLTADQCAELVGRDKLSIRPRFSELSAAGTIAETLERRKNTSGKTAVVWAICSA